MKYWGFARERKKGGRVKRLECAWTGVNGESSAVSVPSSEFLRTGISVDQTGLDYEIRGGYVML